MNKILVILCGRTPQIVTETLYALHEQGRFPSRMIILTTKAGKDACCAHLLHPEHGHLPRLLSDIGRSPEHFAFSEADILVPSEHGFISDIETEEDSRVFFELCLETVFSLSRDHGTELFFSIAGGRKTMSAALALAAQCYARPQDSMFHVLVPPENESNPQFFYPSPPYENVRITLTPIPFFRMRSQLPPELLRTPASLASLSHICMPQTPLDVELDFTCRSLKCGSCTSVLPPALFAVYAFFAMQRTCCPENAEICPDECRACARLWAHIELRLAEIGHLYQWVETRPLARGQRGILHLSAENFRSTLAKLKKMLTRDFGETTGSRLSIVSERQDGGAAYALRIPRRRIRIVPHPADVHRS